MSDDEVKVGDVIRFNERSTVEGGVALVVDELQYLCIVPTTHPTHMKRVGLLYKTSSGSLNHFQPHDKICNLFDDKIDWKQLAELAKK